MLTMIYEFELGMKGHLINYGIVVDADKITKLGVTTINDIFVINNDVKKYVVKIYNFLLK